MSSKERGEITFSLKIYTFFLKKEEELFVPGGGEMERAPGDGHSLAKMTAVESSGQNKNL